MTYEPRIRHVSLLKRNLRDLGGLPRASPACSLSWVTSFGAAHFRPSIKRSIARSLLSTWVAPSTSARMANSRRLVLSRFGAQFVLSSSWRHHHTLAEMQALLEMGGFSGTLIGATPRLFGETRGAEIRTWLQVQPCPPQAFAILDDEPPSDNLGHVWIRTDAAVGVTVSDVQRLIELLT